MGEEQAKSFLESIGIGGWILWLILILVVFNFLMLLPLMKYPQYMEQLAATSEQGQNSGYEEGFKEGYAQGLSECAKRSEAASEIGKENASGRGGGVV
jgi:hypothetical protein